MFQRLVQEHSELASTVLMYDMSVDDIAAWLAEERVPLGVREPTKEGEAALAKDVLNTFLTIVIGDSSIIGA